ncbi:hypothetical protein CsatA_004320 [Cannabis sativa]
MLVAGGRSSSSSSSGFEFPESSVRVHGDGRNGDSSTSTTPLVSVLAAASEAMEFVVGFERHYGLRRPNFVSEGFMDALQRSKNEFKLLFVYLHSPDHTPLFCERTLCSLVLVAL